MVMVLLGGATEVETKAEYHAATTSRMEARGVTSWMKATWVMLTEEPRQTSKI
jgi:hypothetical protein